VKDFLKGGSGLSARPSRHLPAVASEVARFRLISKKPIVAGEAELVANPRSRSAKLRVAEKLGEAA
jgi:16S rRNA (cytosine1402-N4)-methyltransferase